MMPYLQISKIVIPTYNFSHFIIFIIGVIGVYFLSKKEKFSIKYVLYSCMFVFVISYSFASFTYFVINLKKFLLKENFTIGASGHGAILGGILAVWTMM